jgi:hypothetical protein
MNPRVLFVKANDDHTLTIEFANGEVRLFDMRPYLDKGVFQELKDLSYFKAVRPVLGTIQWPHEQDLCPDTLYEDGIPAGGARLHSRKATPRQGRRTGGRRLGARHSKHSR